MKKRMVKPTKMEQQLLDLLEQKGYQIDPQSIKREDHGMQFHLVFSGEKDTFDFSASLILACINELTPWTSPEVANMTDYPEMAMQGDWSGVRDTDMSLLWRIFFRHVVNVYIYGPKAQTSKP